MDDTHLPKRSLTEIPFDILTYIAKFLDICSLWNLLDTCRLLRYSFLDFPPVWRRIVVDLAHCDLSQFYAALRRLRDSNGLRQLVQEVIMDGNDHSMISPLIMLVKFPQLRRLSTRHRRFNTNIEADTKVLQEMLKAGTLRPGTLPLERVDIYHYYMTVEPHLPAFQKTLNRLSRHDHVQLDVRECSDLVSYVDRSLANLRLEQQHGDLLVDGFCQRIVRIDAQCWACGTVFERCMVCVPKCAGCGRKRLPPLVNDQKKREMATRSGVSSRALFQSCALENVTNNAGSDSLDDEFSVFE